MVCPLKKKFREAEFFFFLNGRANKEWGWKKVVTLRKKVVASLNGTAIKKMFGRNSNKKFFFVATKRGGGG